MTAKDNLDFRHRLPKDMQEILLDNKALQQRWKKLTSLARNEWICWVTVVKKTKTRTEHLKRWQEEVKAGKKRPCCWPGCPHRRASANKWLNKD